MDPPRFAKFDDRSRTAKARKIAMLSGVERPAPGSSMLYFGSRSHYFAAYFSRLGFGYSGTFAVDAVDTEQAGSGYQFTEIAGTKLPFPDGRFDFIISNHVIKHFAGREQHMHLAELGRCLRDNGKLYIAVPNRWGLVDAHFRLPFLGWLCARLFAIDAKSRHLRMVPAVAPRSSSHASTAGPSGCRCHARGDTLRG